MTGSLLFGSPHRLVRTSFRSAVLFLRRIDGLNVFRKSTDVLQKRLLATLVTPDILISAWIVFISPSSCGGVGDIAHWKILGEYLIPSYAPSEPLPGTFLGLALDLRSERLYDFAPDIPDFMGLRALRPSAAIVKVMSVPDSRCIRVVTPDDHVNIGFHEILLHDMEEELPFVATSDYHRRV